MEEEEEEEENTVTKVVEYPRRSFFKDFKYCNSFSDQEKRKNPLPHTKKNLHINMNLGNVLCSIPMTKKNKFPSKIQTNDGEVWGFCAKCEEYSKSDNFFGSIIGKESICKYHHTERSMKRRKTSSSNDNNRMFMNLLNCLSDNGDERVPEFNSRQLEHIVKCIWHQRTIHLELCNIKKFSKKRKDAKVKEKTPFLYVAIWDITQPLKLWNIACFNRRDLAKHIEFQKEKADLSKVYSPESIRLVKKFQDKTIESLSKYIPGVSSLMTPNETEQPRNLEDYRKETFNARIACILKMADLKSTPS